MGHLLRAGDWLGTGVVVTGTYRTGEALIMTYAIKGNGGCPPELDPDEGREAVDLDWWELVEEAEELCEYARRSDHPETQAMMLARAQNKLTDAVESLKALTESTRPA